MKTENKIDSYFERVKQNPPLITTEKVHQIINSPKATARLKGKPNNLLKFIVMTTIFAVIISAVLLWPKANDNIPNTIQQNPNKPVKILGSMPTNEDSEDSINDKDSFVVKGSKSNDSKFDNQQIAAVKSDGIHYVESSSDTLRVVEDRESNETLLPTNGDIKKIVADKALLKKLGFQFNNYSVQYQNISPQHDTISYHHIVTKYPTGSSIFTTDLQYVKISDTVFTSNLDFFPVMYSYYSGDIPGYSRKIFKKDIDFESVNDTLLPIYIPSGLIHHDPNDLIMWFQPSEELFQIVPENVFGTWDNFEKIRNYKRRSPKTDCINYKQPKLLDQINFVDLTKAELKNLGLEVMEDAKYFRPGSTGKFIYFPDNKKSLRINWVGQSTFNRQSDEKIEDLFIAFISDIDGDFVSNFITKGKADFKRYVPVLIRKDLVENVIEFDYVFWFELTDRFFELLPEKLSTDLRKEYNYVVAEDKSKLIQPECKYFDECKNTLNDIKFKVFPNPANSQVTVSFNMNEAITGRITLVDLAGRERQVLKSQTKFAIGPHQINVDVSAVPQGIYLITLYSDKGIQTQRFIVTR